MKLIVCNDYDEVSKKAAEIVAELVKSKPDCVLGLPTGSTPIGTYKNLSAMYKNGELDFSKVKSVNLDEYYPISPENDQSYRYFMNTNLFNNINIDKDNTHVPNGSAKDTDVECENYEKMIDSLGGIDLQLLGIGRNGHIGFNEPGDFLYPLTHLTGLTADTINANARFFASEDDVPKHALTMGMGTILNARRILFIATGKEKKNAVKKMLEGKIDTSCPASLLCIHKDVTIICDKAAIE